MKLSSLRQGMQLRLLSNFMKAATNSGTPLKQLTPLKLLPQPSPLRQDTELDLSSNCIQAPANPLGPLGLLTSTRQLTPLKVLTQPSLLRTNRRANNIKSTDARNAATSTLQFHKDGS